MDPFRKLLNEIGEEQMLSYCFTFMTLSTVRPTDEQRQTLEAKFAQDRYFSELREEKPDTLLPDCCIICGAFFVDHGSLACSEEACLYAQREKDRQMVTAIVEAAPQDNWVQCDTCYSWRKIETTEGLPEKWSCSAINKICQIAERYWPAARTKRVVKYFGLSKRVNHMESIKLLAQRLRITPEHLYKMSPLTYFQRMNVGEWETRRFWSGLWGEFTYQMAEDRQHAEIVATMQAQ